MVSNSEFCTENLTTLHSMTYEEFAAIADQVSRYNDLKQAAEEDHQREEHKRAIAQKQSGGR